AITWATKEWDADIVSMSFGYPEELKVDGKSVISKSIYQASADKDSNVLFFAAAANFGGNQREMFPARHDLVFSMRGTDDRGNFEDFNPPPDFAGPDVFGTLGKDVPRLGQDGVVQSGTSIATAIAAGIAAMILGHAKLLLAESPSEENEIIRKLWTKNGMWSMFMLMSEKMQEKLRYLYPIRFLQADNAGRGDYLRTAARDAR
ncbi:hypothetical protein SLS56_011988, partial [Neofusicoccum ribis]